MNRCYYLLPAGLALCWSALSWSAPAPWYWWASRIDGQRVCAQSMPTQGWVRAAGPFDNAACRPAGALLQR